jgi:hypothetical protein
MILKFKHNIKLIILIIIRVSFLLRRVNLFTLSFNNLNADFIVWVPEFYKLKFWGSDNFIRVFAVLEILENNKLEYTIYTKLNIGFLEKKNIIYFPHKYFNLFSFPNYTKIFKYIHDNLEPHNKLLPSYSELIFWENKSFMHNFFSKNDIRTPKTIISGYHDLNLSGFVFPFLLKEEHSCSSEGVHKIDSLEAFHKLIDNHSFRKTNVNIILQDLLNIRRDLRVIIVDNEIVHFYWRINKSVEWKPTSTSFGSEVDFNNFPKKWENWILNNFSKIGLSSGAFDIAWQNDDLDTEPYILEVSPLFQPNPRPIKQTNLIEYGKWKKSLSFSDSYQLEFTKLIFSIQSKIVSKFIKEL